MTYLSDEADRVSGLTLEMGTTECPASPTTLCAYDANSDEKICVYCKKIRPSKQLALT